MDQPEGQRQIVLDCRLVNVSHVYEIKYSQVPAVGYG